MNFLDKYQLIIDRPPKIYTQKVFVMKELKQNIGDDFLLRVKKTSFLSDVLTLVGGTTLAQILTILATPILTRIYGPEEFGLFTLFSSITVIVGVLVCLRYEFSIMLPRSDEEAANLLVLSLFIACLISFFSIPIIWFGGQPLLNILKTPQLEAYLYLVPLFALVSGVYLSLNYWNSRTKRFQRLSVTKVLGSVATAGTQLSAGFAGYATGGSLIGASLVGQSLSTLILGGQIWKDDRSLFLRSVHWETMIEGLKRYRKFPLVDSWSTLLNVVSWQLPAFILASFFSPMVVGFYSLGVQFLQLPMSFIGNSISQVFFQRASEAKAEGTLSSLVENVFRLLVIVGMFPILILTIVGSDIFSIVLGVSWAEAGVYAQIMSVWAFIWFISSPLSTLYIVLEEQQFGLKYNLINFSTRLLSLLMGGFLGSARITLILFSISGIFVYGYLCLKMMSYSKVELSHVKKIILYNLTLFAPAGLILVILKIASISQLSITLISLLFCVIYYLYIIKTDPQIQTLFNIKL